MFSSGYSSIFWVWDPKQIIIIFLLLMLGCAESEPVSPSCLRCELLLNPTDSIAGNLPSTSCGIKDNTPEFGWVVNSALQNDLQTAYHIMVASSPSYLKDNAPDMWDSQKVLDDNSINISYAGKELITGKSYYWKVRTWNKLDQVSSWSNIQEYKTSLQFASHCDTSVARYQQVISKVCPNSVTKILDGHYLVDFGKAAFGYLSWKVSFADFIPDDNSSNGQHQIELHFGEKLLDGHVDRNPGGTVRYYTKSVIFDDYGNLLDFSDQLRWANDNVIENAWIEYDLGTETVVDCIRIRFFHGDTRIFPLKISVGSQTVFTGNTTVGPGYWQTNINPTKGRFVKLSMTAPNSDGSNWFSIFDTKIYSPQYPQFPVPIVSATAGAQEPANPASNSFDKILPDSPRNSGDTREYFIHVGRADRIPDIYQNVGTFRYLEIVNSPVEINPEDLTLYFVHNPFDNDAAHFSCDNDTLNKVWQLSKYSMKETSWCGIFVDGDRERLPYEADAYINQLGYYCVDTDLSIARYTHEYLMRHPTWPTEWKQHSIMMAWADYMYTGNIDSLNANYDDLKNKKLFMAYARPDGLIDPPDRDITDWPDGERDHFEFKPINAVVNAFYYQNLLQMKFFAEALGKTQDADYFQNKAEKVYTSFQDTFYNPDTGLYVDGEGSMHSSIHANMWALAFGLVPEDYKLSVVEYVRTHRRSDSELIPCSVYGVQYLLEALYLYNCEDDAFNIMTNTTPTSWVNMINEGSTVTMEAWGIKYKPNQDWNHAWGAAPANIIPRFLAGIRPLTPGFGMTLIHPQPAELNSFNIKTPTIRGPLYLSMDKKADECMFNLNIPANMTVKFILPKNCDNFPNISLDSSVIRLKQNGVHRYIDSIGSGSHTIVAH